MKTVRQTLLDRRSIRRYEREAVTPQQLDFIYEAIRNTPTSYNAQQFSVIDITDQPLKERLYELTGQKQIKTCSHFMVFCGDFHRISKAARAKGIDMPAIWDTADGLILATVDATLAMMSAVVAAEALGLGTCPIGYARTAAPETFAEELHLPQHVYVVCGLAIGVPRELPDIKPKLPSSVTIHHDRYSDKGITDAVIEYDRLIEQYNATRSGSKTTNDWVEHMIGYYREAMNYTMLSSLAKRGFTPGR